MRKRDLGKDAPMPYRAAPIKHEKNVSQVETDDNRGLNRSERSQSKKQAGGVKSLKFAGKRENNLGTMTRQKNLLTSLGE
jgi:hypothetical protein